MLSRKAKIRRKKVAEDGRSVSGHSMANASAMDSTRAESPILQNVQEAPMWSPSPIPQPPETPLRNVGGDDFTRDVPRRNLNSTNQSDTANTSRKRSKATVGSLLDDIGELTVRNASSDKRKKQKVSKGKFSKFYEILHENGFTLVDEDKYKNDRLPSEFLIDYENFEAARNTINCRPPIFSQKLESQLSRDGRTLREFCESLQLFLDKSDKRILVCCAEPTTLDFDDPARISDLSNYTDQQSLLVILLSIECLQSLMLKWLFALVEEQFVWIDMNAKKPNAQNQIECRKLFVGKLLYQLRMVDRIYEPAIFGTKVFSIINATNVVQFKEELIQLLPAFLVNYEYGFSQSALNRELMTLLKNPSLRGVTIKAIGHLSLPVESCEEFAEEVTNRLCDVSLSDLACITRFVLGNSSTPEMAQETFLKVRNVLKNSFSSTQFIGELMQTGNKPRFIQSTPAFSQSQSTTRCAGPRTAKRKKVERELKDKKKSLLELLNAIHLGARENRTKKMIITAILSTYDEIFKREAPMSIDLIVIFNILSKTPQHEKVTNAFLVKHIKSKRITDIELADMFCNYYQIINSECSDVLLSLAGQLLSSANSILREFGQELYQALVAKSERDFLTKVLSDLVLHLDSNTSHEVDAALSVMFEISIKVPSLVVPILGKIIIDERLKQIQGFSIMQKMAFLRVAAIFAHYQEDYNEIYNKFTHDAMNDTRHSSKGRVLGIVATLAYASSYAKICESKSDDITLGEKSVLDMLTSKSDGFGSVLNSLIEEIDPTTSTEMITKRLKHLVKEIEDDSALFTLYCDLLSQQIQTNQMPLVLLKDRYVEKYIIRKFEHNFIISTTESRRENIHELRNEQSEHCIDINTKHQRETLIPFFRLAWVATENIDASNGLLKFINMPLSVSPSLTDDTNVNWVSLNWFRQILNAFSMYEEQHPLLVRRLEQIDSIEANEFNKGSPDFFKHLTNMSSVFDEKSDSLIYKSFKPNPFASKTKGRFARFNPITGSQATSCTDDNPYLNFSVKENCAFLTDLNWRVFNLLKYSCPKKSDKNTLLLPKKLTLYLLRELHWKLDDINSSQRNLHSSRLQRNVLINPVTLKLHELMKGMKYHKDFFGLIIGCLAMVIDIILALDEPSLLRALLTSAINLNSSPTSVSSSRTESQTYNMSQYKQMAFKLFGKYCDFSRYVRTFPEAVLHVRLMYGTIKMYNSFPDSDISRDLPNSEESDKQLKEMTEKFNEKCEEYLKGDLPEAGDLPQLKAMLDAYLESNPNPLKQMKSMIICAWDTLVGGSDRSDENSTFLLTSNIVKSDYEHYNKFREAHVQRFTAQQLEDALNFGYLEKKSFHVFFDVILRKIASFMSQLPTDGNSVVKRRALENWTDLANLYRVATTLTKGDPTNKALLKSAIRTSKTIMDHVNRKAIPLIDKCCDEMQMDCINLAKSIQAGTRYMQRLCTHGKSTKDSNLMRGAPMLKKVLEEFMLRLKQVFTTHGCGKMLEINNLKLKGLHNEELPLTLMRSEKEVSDEEEEDESGDESDAEEENEQEDDASTAASSRASKSRTKAASNGSISLRPGKGDASRRGSSSRPAATERKSRAKLAKVSTLENVNTEEDQEEDEGVQGDDTEEEIVVD